MLKPRVVGVDSALRRTRIKNFRAAFRGADSRINQIATRPGFTPHERGQLHTIFWTSQSWSLEPLYTEPERLRLAEKRQATRRRHPPPAWPDGRRWLCNR
jgi:hypothetical protein